MVSDQLQALWEALVTGVSRSTGLMNYGAFCVLAAGE